MGTSDSAVEEYAGAIEPASASSSWPLPAMSTSRLPSFILIRHPHLPHVIPGIWYTVTATNAAAICQRWFRIWPAPRKT